MEGGEAAAAAAATSPRTNLPVNGDAARTTIAAGAADLFTLTVPSSFALLLIKLRVLEGDADLYASCSVDTPTRHTWTWRNIDTAVEKSVVIPCTHADIAGQAVLHVAVITYGTEPASVELTCSVSEAAASAAAPPTAPLSQSSSGSSDTAPCPNCKAAIAVLSLDRHVAFCTRNNYCCAACGKVMRIADKDAHTHCALCSAVVSPAGISKHMDLEHGSVKCECGAEVSAADYALHKEFECDLRVVPCPYCEARFTERKLGAHQVRVCVYIIFAGPPLRLCLYFAFVQCHCAGVLWQSDGALCGLQCPRPAEGHGGAHPPWL